MVLYNCSRVAHALQIEKLLVAKEHGCYDVIHWNEACEFCCLNF